MKRKILIVDDEEHILELLKINLEFSGYEIYTHSTGSGVLEIIEQVAPDLILLDLMLPEIDGIELCKRIRNNPEFNRIRILIVSAKSDEIDKVLCLEIGADDYITKPFSLRELLVRVKVFFRRMDMENVELQPIKNEKIESETIIYKDLIINTAEGSIYKNNEKLDLTTKEFKLFTFLLSHKGKVVSRENIIEQVWKFDKSTSRSLDVHIRKLRIKLGDHNNSYLETIRGVGYLVPLE